MSSYQLGHQSWNHLCLSSYWVETFCVIWSADEAPNGTWNEIFQYFVRCLINSNNCNQGTKLRDWFESCLWQTFRMQLCLFGGFGGVSHALYVSGAVCKWGWICWGVFVLDRDDKVTPSQRREPDRVVECAVLAFSAKTSQMIWSK